MSSCVRFSCIESEDNAVLGVPAALDAGGGQSETRGLVTGTPAYAQQGSGLIIRGIELAEASKPVQCIQKTFYCSGNIRTLHD